ncbi:hypothetical protein AL035_17890 [Salipiger aestuarii]|uniref:Uncharacterized protein n=1 Tax=Salipiger aestuarii TaxID=568098 RepID=A0A327XMW6_9RHOB|nr:hypothetical protein [Salipiger aestuarii]KAB2539637.1 hypothetical protein AL035_17890 [Salipiger aestuarii]RAK10458.1 hypothetical protein ATI53_105622 [Salipiger aestuarii]
MTAPPVGADLRSLLDRAAAHGLAAPVAHHAACAEDALGHAVQAVRGCILPRRLTLALDGSPVIDLLAAGGRLLGLEQATGGGAEGDPRSDTATSVAELLRGRLTGGLVTVTSLPLDRAIDASHTGIAASDLYAALGLAPMDHSADARRAALLAAADDVIIAVLSATDPPELTPEITPVLMSESGARVPPDVLDCVGGWLAPGGLAHRLGRDELMVLALDEPPLGIGLLVTGGTPEALIFDVTACADLARFWSELTVMTGVLPESDPPHPAP